VGVKRESCSKWFCGCGSSLLRGEWQAAANKKSISGSVKNNFLVVGFMTFSIMQLVFTWLSFLITAAKIVNSF
jgi:hypothetical protein